MNIVIITPPEGKEGHVITLAQVTAGTSLTRQQVEEQLQGQQRFRR